MTRAQTIIKYVAFAVAALLIVGIFTGVGELLSHLFDDKTPGEVKEYQISDGVSELDIDIGAAEMRIVMSDTLYIESNLRNLTVEERGGKLKIEEKTLFGTNGNDTYLTLYIPDGYTFTNLDIDAGAGRLTAEKLSAERLSLTLGAGEVVIGELTVSASAEIEGGAGALKIESGRIAGLDIEMGAGALTMTASLVGKCEIDQGVGEIDLTLVGDINDYCITANKGIGDIIINESQISTGAVIGTGENKIELNGGIGKIVVKTKK